MTGRTTRQFRVLYRDFLFGIVDRELLSTHAKGGASQLLPPCPHRTVGHDGHGRGAFAGTAAAFPAGLRRRPAPGVRFIEAGPIYLALVRALGEEV